MRGQRRVNGSLSQLGVTRADLDAAAREAEGFGLETPGHPMELYFRLLGEPEERDIHDDADPYREVVIHYRLPLWPRFRLRICGSREGQTGGIRFSKLPGEQPIDIADAEHLAPSEVVEDQVTKVLAPARVVHEWYPQRDYEVSIGGATIASAQ